jgi:hypothetical protein
MLKKRPNIQDMNSKEADAAAEAFLKGGNVNNPRNENNENKEHNYYHEHYKNNGIKFYNLPLPAEVLFQAKLICAKSGISMKDYFTKAIINENQKHI